MSEQQLDGAQIGSGFQQMSGKSVTQTMGSDAFGDAGALTGYLADLLNGAVADRFASLGARKEPEWRASLLTPGAQLGKQFFGQHYIAVFFPLALFHANRHALAVKIGDAEIGFPAAGRLLLG